MREDRVSEQKRYIRGKFYVPVVLRVEQDDEQGRPFVVTTLYDEQAAELSPTDESKNRFWIVWAPEEMVRPGGGK